MTTAPQLLALAMAQLLVMSGGVVSVPVAAIATQEIGPIETIAGERGVPIGAPGGLVAVDDTLFIGDRDGWVHRIDPDGTVTTLAGNGRQETSGDDGPAVDAGLRSALGVAFIRPGWLYIAEPPAHRVRLVSPDGRIHTAAGTGEDGVGGDGGNASNARLRRPTDVAIGPDSQLYIADAGANQVRMVQVFVDGDVDGTISTVAGTGEPGAGGDGGPATEAQLASPSRVAAGPDGEFYILESPEGPTRIRRVDPDGTISTVLGGGTCGDDGEQAPLSLCDGASDIAVDSDGALYVHDRGSDAVWRVVFDGDRIRLPVYLRDVVSLTVSADDDLYVGRRADAPAETYVVERVSLSVAVPPVAEVAPRWENRDAGTVLPAAGTGDPGFGGDGGPATEAQLAEPGSLAAGPDGVVYIADRRNGRIRSVDAEGNIRTFAGNGEEPAPPTVTRGPAPGDGQAGTEVPLRSSIGGLAAGPDGSVYLCDPRGHRVYRVNPLGAITTFAGTGQQAHAGDAGPAVDAALSEPVDVAIGPDGSAYIADNGNDRIRKVDPAGTITTVTELDDPRAVEVAPDGAVYAAGGGAIWRVDASSGGAPVELAAIAATDLAVGPDGLLYASNGAEVLSIRDDGTTEVVRGTEAGDDSPPIDSIAFDRAGNLYLSHPAANQVSVVVRATQEPAGFPWQWVILALVAAATAAGVIIAVRAGRRRTPGVAAATNSS